MPHYLAVIFIIHDTVLLLWLIAEYKVVAKIDKRYTVTQFDITISRFKKIKN